ncbi:MAG: gliding motility-associated C-terminal domain-containing protein [Flavobacteriales bacterium]|nr:gliding motility-associated C-terminal domain-containing protein [Flavobacteriales bacterium]
MSHVTDQYGCSDSLCKVVGVLVPSVFIPNSFTPDGNNLNEIFQPVLADMVLEDHLFEVYDRWGQLVYHTNDMEQGWDGRHQNGGDILPLASTPGASSVGPFMLRISRNGWAGEPYEVNPQYPLT